MTLIIKKPIDQGAVVSFRLVSGETLIAKFVKQTPELLTVTRPVVANPIQQDGNFGIYYTPFCATVDEDQEFRIPVSSLLLEPMRPRAELEQSFIKMTTGLDIPAS